MSRNVYVWRLSDGRGPIPSVRRPQRAARGVRVIGKVVKTSPMLPSDSAGASRNGSMIGPSPAELQIYWSDGIGSDGSWQYAVWK